MKWPVTSNIPVTKSPSAVITERNRRQVMLERWRQTDVTCVTSSVQKKAPCRRTYIEYTKTKLIKHLNTMNIVKKWANFHFSACLSPLCSTIRHKPSKNTKQKQKGQSHSNPLLEPCLQFFFPLMMDVSDFLHFSLTSSKGLSNVLMECGYIRTTAINYFLW